MFDVGFWELALVAVIGLIVLGPERLPRAARTLGLWLGRARRYANSLRDELENATGADDLREDFESLRRDVDSVRGEMTRGGRQLRAEVEGDEDASPAPEEPERQTDSGHTDRDPETDSGPASQSGRRLRAETRSGDDEAPESPREDTAEQDAGEASSATTDAERRG